MNRIRTRKPVHPGVILKADELYPLGLSVTAAAKAMGISLLTNPFLIGGMLAAQAIHIIAMQTPGISTLLDLEPVSGSTWVSLLGIALILVIVDEMHKWLKHR